MSATNIQITAAAKYESSKRSTLFETGKAESAALFFLAIFPLKVINAIVPHLSRSHLLLITSQRDGVSEYRQWLRLE